MARNTNTKISWFILICQSICLIAFQVKSQVPDIIEIETGMNRPGNLTLNDIAANIQYITLETKENNLISYVDKLKFNDKFIFVQNVKPPALYVFDYSGKFINKIGHQGNGPEEYNFLLSFCISDFTRQVYLLIGVPYKLMIFDYFGEFIKQYNYSQSIGAQDIEFLDRDKFLLMRSNSQGNTPFSYSLFTSDFISLKNAVKPFQYVYSGKSFSSKSDFTHYVFNNCHFVKENVLNDTLYKISPSFEFMPQYVFEQGKFKQTMDFRLNFTEYFKRNDLNYIMFNSFFETSKVLIFSYSFNKKSSFYYFDKSKKETYSLNRKGIPNDIDGGLDFKPIYQLNNKWIGYVNALELKTHVASDAFKNATPKFPEKKKELEKLANSLNENDNPVLMLVKLKE